MQKSDVSLMIYQQHQWCNIADIWCGHLLNCFVVQASEAIG